MSHQLPTIGNTPLIHAKKLGSFVGLPHIYIKLESKNPTHTHKDRAAQALVSDAIEKGYAELTIGTCGNFGVSVAMLCGLYGLKCIVFMPKRYQGVRGREMEAAGATVLGAEGAYEDAVEQSAMYARSKNAYDANPTSSYAAAASIRSYAEIAYEIDKVVPRPQTQSVWVPVGNGTTLAGLHYGYKVLGSTPVFGAVSSKGNNAILTSFAQRRPVELDPNSLVETHVNEPLLNYRSYQVDEAMMALDGSGKIYGATDSEMLDAAKTLYEKERVTTQPASASVLSGLLAHAGSLHKDRSHILILTS